MINYENSSILAQQWHIVPYIRLFRIWLIKRTGSKNCLAGSKCKAFAYQTVFKCYLKKMEKECTHGKKIGQKISI